MKRLSSTRWSTAARLAVLAGAGGLIGFMLRAGRRNTSIILPLLFAVWVLSPFAAAALTSFLSKSWSAFARAALHSVMLTLTLGSLAIYGYFAWRPPAKAASVFLMIPLLSWLFIALALVLNALLSSRRARRADGNGDQE